MHIHSKSQQYLQKRLQSSRWAFVPQKADNQQTTTETVVALVAVNYRLLDKGGCLNGEEKIIFSKR
jgi:hypothetical protein